MPFSFTPFNTRNRDAGIEYFSQEVQVPDNGDTRCRFSFDNIDFSTEPESTIVIWKIQTSPDGVTWSDGVGGRVYGKAGKDPSPRPVTIQMSVTDFIGQYVRGSLQFTNDGNRRMRFGISGETF